MVDTTDKANSRSSPWRPSCSSGKYSGDEGNEARHAHSNPQQA